jgi:hypothetical protein
MLSLFILFLVGKILWNNNLSRKLFLYIIYPFIYYTLPLYFLFGIFIGLTIWYIYFMDLLIFMGLNLNPFYLMNCADNPSFINFDNTANIATSTANSTANIATSTANIANIAIVPQTTAILPQPTELVLPSSHHSSMTNRSSGSGSTGSIYNFVNNLLTVTRSAQTTLPVYSANVFKSIGSIQIITRDQGTFISPLYVDSQFDFSITNRIEFLMRVDNGNMININLNPTMAQVLPMDPTPVPPMALAPVPPMDQVPPMDPGILDNRPNLDNLEGANSERPLSNVSSFEVTSRHGDGRPLTNSE